MEAPSQMAELAAAAARDLAEAPAQDVIAWATETFGDRVCITSSMTDAVIIHLAASVKPGLDVVFLDTGYHFPETIGTRDAVQAIYREPHQRHSSRGRGTGRRTRAPAVRAEPGPVLLPA
jgi:phosphoadenosine phosphosulfate reductase